MHVSFERNTRGLFSSSTKVSTEVTADGAAHADIDNSRTLHSPANFIPAPLPGLQWRLPLPAKDGARSAVAGSELFDAVQRFEQLGAKHGVEGVLFHEGQSGRGGIMLAGGRAPGYEWGNTINDRVGLDNINALSEAARAVLQAAGVL